MPRRRATATEPPRAPSDEQPVQRLLRSGPEVLTDAELLAVVLGDDDGGACFADVAQELLEEVDGLAGLQGVPPQALQRPGIDEAQAATLVAALDLARRFACPDPSEGELFGGPSDVVTYLFLRCFRSGIAVLALVLLLSGARRPWRHGWGLLGVGAAYGATLVLFVVGNKLTTAANTTFLQSTAPLYVLALAPWSLGERARRRDLVYMAALAVGLSLLYVGQRQPDALAPDPFTGRLLAALSGVTWGLTLLGLRSLGCRDELDAADAGGLGGAGAAAAMVGNLFAFAVCLPAALLGLASVTGIASVQAIGPRDCAIVVFLGVFQVAIAYIFLTRGLRRVGALEASLLLLVEPVLNPVWAWLFHGEEPGGWALTGGAVILTATLTKSVVDARNSGRA